ncbi:MAG: hypothetical protein Q9175_000880 [Cornicularia normoerica]
MCRFDFIWWEPCKCKVFNGPPIYCRAFLEKPPQYEEKPHWGLRVWIEPDRDPAVDFEEHSIRYQTVDPERNQHFTQIRCPGQEYYVKYLERRRPCLYHDVSKQKLKEEKNAQVALARRREESEKKFTKTERVVR